MAEFPALPIWTDAYMLDCGHLSDAEHGRYFLLLMLIWRSSQCRIPNEPEWIARKMKRSPEAYQSEIAPLIAEFCVTTGNWVTQKRLTEEFKYLQKQRSQRIVAANTRWGNNKKDASASPPHTTSHAPRNAPTPTPTPSKEKDKQELVQKESRGERLPAQFSPDQSCIDLASKLGYDRMEEGKALENFTDYWKGVAGAKGVKLDWQATYRNWLRNNHNRKANGNGRQHGHARNSLRSVSDRVGSIIDEQIKKLEGEGGGAEIRKDDSGADAAQLPGVRQGIG